MEVMGCSSGLHVGSSTGLISKSFQPTNYPSTSTGALGKVFVNTVAWMGRCEVWLARLPYPFFFTTILKRRRKKTPTIEDLFIVAETIESASASTATSFRISHPVLTLYMWAALLAYMWDPRRG
jgi:hypothetical protein